MSVLDDSEYVGVRPRRTNRVVVGIAACVFVAIATASAYAIGFIDSPSASCRKIKGNECAISWYYLSVSASPDYMIGMRIQLQLVPGGPQVLVFHTQGFFQTSMYVPYDMIGEFKVPCGKEGTTPDPFPQPSPGIPYGNAYAYTIRARDSANLSSSNYGTVFCPPK